MHCTKRGKLAVLSIGVLVAMILVCYFYLIQKSRFRFAVSSSKLLEYNQAAITSDSSMCSQLGMSILREKNGSTIDSVIVTLVCMALDQPMSTGIGGSLIMNIYDSKSQKNVIIDASGKSPHHVTSLKNMSHLTGPSSVTVPGQLYGLWQAHQMYGSLPWKHLFAPVIHLATQGFNVSRLLANTLKEMESEIKDQPLLRELYVNEATRHVYQEGDLMKHPRLAKTLEIISEEGFLAVYNGSLSNAIVEDLRDAGEGSLMSLSDLTSYNVKFPAPLRTRLSNGDQVMATPPPSSGPIVQLILNVLDLYEFKPNYRTNLNMFATTLHRIIETFKFAYGIRSRLEDPGFDEDVTQFLVNLTSTEWATGIKSQIDDHSTYDSGYYNPGTLNEEGLGTTHLNCIGLDGIAVSVTSSLNHRFGAQILGRRTGILFNNGMAAFSTPSRHNRSASINQPLPNLIGANKSPMSYVSPIIMTDNTGNTKLVIGASGGTKIISSLSYVMNNLVWFNDTIKEAIDALRVHDQILPAQTNTEDYLPKKVIEKLKKFGHDITSYGSLSFVHGIYQKNGTFSVNIDYRSGAIPAGF
ncbi:glutathione hydrolase 1 proenzyme-like isoform X1 [Octopus vulgaris]|uniref:Glutathione hydrolase 1 proenzyme-like isoform X1 n=1 Tax=Octopus vulgaris TaxID=6645 RepID=A0AA36FGQ1_OCTVU|nr:glutathione hydrolase 1 proenzyme-like isoform X1 [Octopus vulgaris]